MTIGREDVGAEEGDEEEAVVDPEGKMMMMMTMGGSVEGEKENDEGCKREGR